VGNIDSLHSRIELLTDGQKTTNIRNWALLLVDLLDLGDIVDLGGVANRLPNDVHETQLPSHLWTREMEHMPLDEWSTRLSRREVTESSIAMAVRSLRLELAGLRMNFDERERSYNWNASVVSTIKLAEESKRVADSARNSRAEFEQKEALVHRPREDAADILGNVEPDSDDDVNSEDGAKESSRDALMDAAASDAGSDVASVARSAIDD